MSDASPATVAILLATYNGEEHLREQLDSLLAQTFTGFEILARDDRSQDHTVDILREYAARDPRIRILTQVHANVGPVKSFGMLLGAAVLHEYVFFCDQDDVWAPDKVEATVRAIKEVEAAHGPHTPIAVHTDIELIDAEGRPIVSSWRARTGLPKAIGSFWPLIGRNFVTGCSLALNRALVRASLPVSKEAMMHDWWIAAVAQATGRLAYLDRPLVKYRQHARNASGALAEFGLWNKFRRRLLRPERFRELLVRRFRQSLALEQHLRTLGYGGPAAELRDFHASVARGRWSAVSASRSRGIQLFDWKRTLLFRLLLLAYQPRVRKLITLRNSLLRSS